MTTDVPGKAKDLLAPLLRARLWMRFLAILSILSGVLMIFSVLRLLVFWLPVWAGVALWQAVDALERVEFGEDALPAVHRGLDRIRLYFVLYGISMAILITVTVLALLGGYALLAVLPGW